MRRRLLNLLTLVSLLAAAAMVTLWVCDRDQFVFTTGRRMWWVMCYGGAVHTRVHHPWPQAVPPRSVSEASGERVPAVEFGKPFSTWRGAGIVLERTMVTTRFNADGTPMSYAEYERHDWKRSPPRESAPLRCFGVRVPHWMLVGLAAALPAGRAVAAVVRGWSRRARMRGGMCAVCGYDLRATPGRCPECGEAVPAAGSPQVKTEQVVAVGGVGHVRAGAPGYDA